MPVDFVGSSEWGSVIESSKEPVLIEFVSKVCPICDTMDPFVENIAEKYADKVKVYKVDVISERPLALKFGVQATPTFLMMCKGNPIASLIGEVRPSMLEWMASDTLLHNEGCSAKQTKVVYTIIG